MKKFIIHMLAFLLLFIGLNQIIGYYYEKPIRHAITNKTHMKYLKWKEIHDSSNMYNLIFLGSSRGYSAYNPDIFDSLLNFKTFNMCTGSQDIIEANYILKEILRFQKPKFIIYELFLPSFSSRTDFYPVLSNAYFMSLNGKIDMILMGYGIDGFANYALPLLKHRNYIKRDITNILFHNSRKPGILAREETTWIKGYCYNEMVVDKATINNFSDIYNFDNTNIDNKKLNEGLQKLSKTCNENLIKLICVRAPYPPTRMAISPPDTAGLFFNKLCKDLEIPFYDFNYIHNKDLSYFDIDFADYHHLNNVGANKVSIQLSKILFNNFINK